MVAIYDLFEAGRVNDLTVNFLISFLNKTNRFHVAVCLFSNITHKTSKYGQNISDTHSPNGSCATFLFLPHFDVICDLHAATWNLFVNLFQLQPNWITNTTMPKTALQQC